MSYKSLTKLYLNRGIRSLVKVSKKTYIYYLMDVIDSNDRKGRVSVLSVEDIIEAGINIEHFHSLKPTKRYELIDNLAKEIRDNLLQKIESNIEEYLKKDHALSSKIEIKVCDLEDNYSCSNGTPLIFNAFLNKVGFTKKLDANLIKYNEDKKANNLLNTSKVLNSWSATGSNYLVYGDSQLSTQESMEEFAGISKTSYPTLHYHMKLGYELVNLEKEFTELSQELNDEVAKVNNLTRLLPSDPGFEEITDPRACAFTALTLDTVSIDSHSKKGSFKNKADNNDSSNEKNSEELHDIGDNLSFIGTQEYNQLLSIDKAAERAFSPAKVINEEEEQSILSQECTEEDLLIYDQLDDEQDDEGDLSEVELDRSARYSNNQLKKFKDPTEMDFSIDSTSNRPVITSSTSHEEIEQVANSLMQAISPVRDPKSKNIPQLSSSASPSHSEQQTKKKVAKRKSSSRKKNKKRGSKKAKNHKKYLSANNQRTYKTGKKAIKGAVTIDTHSKIATRVKAYRGNTSDIVIFFYEIARLCSLASNLALSGIVLPLMLICDRIFFCSPVVFELVGLGVHFVIAAKKQLCCWKEGKDKLWMLKNAIIDWCKQNGFLYANLFKESNIIMRERVYKEIDFASLGIDPHDFAIQLHNRTINLKMKTEYTATQHKTLSCFKLDDDGKQYTRTVPITYVVSLSLDHYYSSLNRFSDKIKKVQEAIKYPEEHFRGLTYKVANPPKEGQVAVTGIKFFAPEVLERKAFDDAVFVTATSMTDACIELILNYYDLRINVERVIHLMKNVNEMSPLRTAEENAVDSRMFVAQLTTNFLIYCRNLLRNRYDIDMTEEQIRRRLRKAKIAHFAKDINYCKFEDNQKLLIKELMELDLDKVGCILVDDVINVIKKPKPTAKEIARTYVPSLYHSKEFLQKQEAKQKIKSENLLAHEKSSV